MLLMRGHSCSLPSCFLGMARTELGDQVGCLQSCASLQATERTDTSLQSRLC